MGKRDKNWNILVYSPFYLVVVPNLMVCRCREWLYTNLKGGESICSCLVGCGPSHTRSKIDDQQSILPLFQLSITHLLIYVASNFYTTPTNLGNKFQL